MAGGALQLGDGFFIKSYTQPLSLKHTSKCECSGKYLRLIHPFIENNETCKQYEAELDVSNDVISTPHPVKQHNNIQCFKHCIMNKQSKTVFLRNFGHALMLRQFNFLVPLTVKYFVMLAEFLKHLNL